MVATIYGAEKDVYLVGTQQLYELGQKLETPDGSIFRFTEMAGTVGVANKLYQSSVAVADWTDQDIGTAVVAGATSILFKDAGTAFVVDEAAGGTLHAEEASDLGATYRIKSNTVTASNDTLMQLENGVVALAAITANPFTFIKNPWKDVIIHPASAPTALTIGVQRNIIAINGFGWTQSRGVATCLSNGVAVAAQPLVASNAVAGATANKRTIGTGEVANAQTTDVITHNSGNTPVGGDITIQYLEDPTAPPETMWIDTIGATQFTVNVETDPSTNGLDFGWVLEVAAPVVAICLEVGDSAEFQPVFLKIE